MDLKYLLKRGALLAAANWPVVLVQFAAQTIFKLLLLVPLVGAAVLVSAFIGGDAAALLQGGLRDMFIDVDPQKPPLPVGGREHAGVKTCIGQHGTHSYFQSDVRAHGRLVWRGTDEEVVGDAGWIDRQWTPRHLGIHQDLRSTHYRHEWRQLHLDNGVGAVGQYEAHRTARFELRNLERRAMEVLPGERRIGDRLPHLFGGGADVDPEDVSWTTTAKRRRLTRMVANNRGPYV